MRAPHVPCMAMRTAAESWPGRQPVQSLEQFDAGRRRSVLRQIEHFNLDIIISLLAEPSA